PFQINTDPRFLWLGEKHKEALSVLRYGVQENLSFLLLTGDVGTGKTTLVNSLLERLESNVLVARIPDPALDLMDFINILSRSFGMNETFKSRGPFIARFEEFLTKQHYSGKNVLLIIDEAQRLTYDLLEEIRALSNLEKPHAKLLNVFFVGQEEFNDMLLDSRSRAIRQRISLSYHLDPLSRKEAGEYIRHRQIVAGARMNLFPKKAADIIYEFSGGFPRLINVICDNCLLTAYAENKAIVTEGIARECAHEMKIRSFAQKPEKTPNHIQSPDFETQSNPVGRVRKPRRRKRLLVAVVILFFLVICGYAAYLWLPASAEWAEWLSVFYAADMIKGQENQAAPTGNTSPESGKATPKNPDKTDSQPDTQKQTTQPETKTTVRAEQLRVRQKPQSNVNNTENNKTVASVPGVKKASGPDDARRQAPEKLVIYFPHDAYGLNSTSFETLAQAKQLLRQDPQLKADILGYTDSLGDPEYNRYLSQLRANIVSKYLTGDGVEPEQTKPKGLGPLPRENRHQTPEERAGNRRVEIVFDYRSQ
ncbi:MAG: AAA family ATPase, partial [Desulfobacteraceae bacterium]|nr:AAA family ATPase [Desulfobacteraceae bacterium]